MNNNSNKLTMSFVVPALNEEANIELAVQEILIAAEGWFSDYEILLINDASTDATGTTMEKLASQNNKIHVIHNEKNLGLGGAYKRGIAAAQLEYVMMIPGDNAHPATGLYPIFEGIGQADIVIPYVVNPQARSWIRRLISRSFVILLNSLSGLRIRYYNGLVVHRTDLLKLISINTDGFAYQAEALIKLIKQGQSYIEIGTTIDERKTGGSKALRLKNVISVIKVIIVESWKFRKR
ncbi:glycosyl transferase, group 2 family protein [Beggiatoa sp. PS]|nr:glycosyl transferase, group 2 family protein [Beggiatoa sp. PS]